MIDFEMTYPCYSPLQPTGMPFTFNAGGDQAIAVCTDDYILDRFFATVLPHLINKGRLVIQHREALCAVLRGVWNKPIAKGQPVTHVVIDPTGGVPKVRTYSIQEFLGHLENAA
jgi:hypothetical protein